MIYITWLNNLGGFQYWPLIGRKDLNLDVFDTGETVQNIFPDWGKSYDFNADTIRKQTYRKSRKQLVLRTHAMSRQEASDLAEGIKSSILVQIMNTKDDRLTVLVDSESITVYKEADKLHSLSFTATYTNELPAQTV